MHGRLLVNSFEVSNDAGQLLGYALYLGPSILDHSCRPSAEVSPAPSHFSPVQVTFQGSRLEVHSKVARGTSDLRKMSISYIDLDLGREERRQLLRTHFHFECQCSLCVGEDVEAPQHLVDLSKLHHSVAAAVQVTK